MSIPAPLNTADIDPIDLYWSFRSPYSYLALKQLNHIRAERGANFNVKIVLPLAIRDPEFFNHKNPLFLGYVMRDVFRLAQMSGQIIMPPKPDPIVQNMESREIAAKQPFIHHLSHLGCAATDMGRGLEFITAMSAHIWSGQDWNNHKVKSKAAQAAGLDYDHLEQMVTDNESEYAGRLITHDKDLRAAGHWGVPTFVYKCEPFFGQDRIDALLWRLDQNSP